MPQALSVFALQLIASLGVTSVLASNLIYLGTLAAGYAALGFGLQAVSSLFIDKPSVPKPEDGNYNLKQSVPSLSFVLGRTKKASDYLFLEERDGEAFHILCTAGHRIQGYVDHYLHDEIVTLDVDGVVTAPTHFAGGYVKIKTRLGLNAETAYSEIVSKFPEIWTNDHRGDGLATVMMSCDTASQEDQLEVYPNQMPQHSSVVDGAFLYDPRNEDHDPDDELTWDFATNIALFRLWHLTHPVGGKLKISDLYLPEWIRAADVCDQSVINRDGDTEPRYHGGLWFRANSNPVEVGKLMDQAAELVVYERPDGLIGVHPGEFVEPDIRLTADDIISLAYDANKGEETTVLAVRGRYTSPENTFNTVDAAIMGDPYVGEETERTKTLDNQIVQSHNHIQRLQNISFIRANAPRVSVVAHYEPAEDVDSRRFIIIHHPPKLVEAVIEITSTPTISLANMTVEFAGIVVPRTLYDFDASTQEGEPPPVPEDVVSTGVPVPTGFDITIEALKLTGGNTAAFGVATWDFVSDKLLYELEWQPTSGANQSRQNNMSQKGEDEIRTGYLLDGVPHRFRLRAWSGGKHSEWTDYIVKTPYADTVEPVALGSFTLTAGQNLGNAKFTITTANDPHLRTVAIYRKAHGVALDLSTDTPIRTLALGPLSTYGYVDGDATRANLLLTPDFATDTNWTKGAGWTISAGVAARSLAAASNLTQTMSIGAVTYRTGVDVKTISGGSVRPRLTGGTAVSPAGTYTTTGYKLDKVTGNGTNTGYSINADASFVGSIDDVVLFQETPSCAPQGVWDYYAVPFNGSDLDGPVSGPVTATVI